MAAEALSAITNAEIDTEEFYQVLSNIHCHSRHLQNKPPQYVPKEDLVACEVIEVLKPYTVENGGPLIVKKVFIHISGVAL
jgi:acetylornithine deacetylase